jgi:hypothetical protein
MTNLSPAAQMTDQHPITPPPELVTDWCGQLARENDYGPTCVYDIATQAAQWGADQERARAALAQPEPQGPTQAELRTFACKWWRSFGFVKNKATCTWVIDQIAPEHFVDFSRDLLARWGTPTNTINQED